MKPPYFKNGYLKGLSSKRKATSVPGFKVCVSIPYDVRTMTKSPNEAFLRKYPRR